MAPPTCAARSGPTTRCGSPTSPSTSSAAARSRASRRWLRWDHPERGPIPPADFIPVAEDSGLIVELGEYVLRTAGQLARLIEIGCDYAQGYYLARPLAAGEVEALLRSSISVDEGHGPALRRPA